MGFHLGYTDTLQRSLHCCQMRNVVDIKMVDGNHVGV